MTRLTITSTAFVHGGAMPARYSCDGPNVSPPLTIANVPGDAKSLALIVDDPDAPGGTWVHWVVWNISPGTEGVGENALPAGAVQGLNDWQRNRYGGPCPPSGTHRYFFRVFALDRALNLPSTTTAADLKRAMAGHVIAQGELMGTYRRR